jgi:hypothetical protein
MDSKGLRLIEDESGDLAAEIVPKIATRERLTFRLTLLGLIVVTSTKLSNDAYRRPNGRTRVPGVEFSILKRECVWTGPVPNELGTASKLAKFNDFWTLRPFEKPLRKRASGDKRTWRIKCLGLLSSALLRSSLEAAA